MKPEFFGKKILDMHLLKLQNLVNKRLHKNKLIYMQIILNIWEDIKKKMWDLFCVAMSQ